MTIPRVDHCLACLTMPPAPGELLCGPCLDELAMDLGAIGYSRPDPSDGCACSAGCAYCGRCCDGRCGNA